MEFPVSESAVAASATSAATAASPASSSSSPTDHRSSPASPVTPSSPLTDTQLLQLSLQNAVAAASAGKATVAANNYALVVKIFFRKCFLLEELVLLALAMGYETRKAAAQTRKGKGKAGEATPTALHRGVGGDPQWLLPSVAVDSNDDVDDNSRNSHHPSPTPDGNTAQLVDPLASVGMLLPPGLDEDDYDEERNYYEQKRQREMALAHTQQPKQPQLISSSASSASLAGNTSIYSDKTFVDDVPGYDAATARWLACLLAKVHPDALPIATLEKLCKVPIPSRKPGVLVTGDVPNAAAAGPSTSATRGNTITGGSHGGGSGSGDAGANRTATVFPTSSSAATAASAAGGASVDVSNNNNSTASPLRSDAIARLIPHFKSSPTASSIGSNAGSPTFSTATTAGSPRAMSGGISDANAVLGTSSSSSLSLLFATLLWNVACALWNEGFVEDTHHWLSVMDVRRLWKLYGDSCVKAAAAAGTGAGGLVEESSMSGGNSISPKSARVPPPGPFPLLPSSSSPSRPASNLFSSAEPSEERVESEERACALSWPAVLAECSAAEEPPSTSYSRSTAAHSRQDPPSLPSPAAAAAVSAAPPTVSPNGSDASLRPLSGITLSAFSHASSPLPITCPTSGVDDLTAAAVAPAVSAAEKVSPTFSSFPASATAVLEVIPKFVRRLARRTSALRDLCGLMMGCETAEDVFYIVYALHCALETQQRKMAQQQQQSTETAGKETKWAPAKETAAAATAATTSSSSSSGGLAEVLIVANLLVEFFLSKRAQKILLDAGVLPTHLPPTMTGDERGANAAPCPSPSSPPLHQARRGELRRRTDRAVRQACDEVVCAFTNGQCLTLYGLESYGIPAPHNSSNSSGGEDSGHGGGAVQLLAAELPYVLVVNVLSSTLNFATLYRLSKIYQGVMNTRSGGAAAVHGQADGKDGNPAQEAGGHTHQPTWPLVHPNRTRKATEEERLRRRRWTRGPAAATPAAAPHLHPQHPPHAAQSIVEGLLNFMKDAAVGWRSAASAAHLMSAEAEGRMETPTATPSPRHDVRPSCLDVAAQEPNDASTGPSGKPGGGGYAEKLAEARREHAAAAATPAKKAVLQVQTNGHGACELLVPSHPSINSSSSGRARTPASGGAAATATTLAAATAAAEVDMHSRLTIPLLPEENERMSLADRTSAVPPVATFEVADTMLYTPSAQLQSRSPSEAACLRLLTLLYRYPQLHTLEPITANHVDLVAKELNKALHILQVAMRSRFGERWWQQWRARREGETQRYYARALADAQRGGRVLRATTTTASENNNSNSGAAARAVQHTAAITDPAPASPTLTRVPSPVEPVPPPSMVGTTAVQPDPSLVLRPPDDDDDAPQRRPPFELQPDSPQRSLGQSPQQQLGMAELSMTDYSAIPPPAAPLPTPRQEPVLSSFWNTRTLSIPTDECIRERRLNPRRCSIDITSAEEAESPLVRGGAAAPPAVAAGATTTGTSRSAHDAAAAVLTAAETAIVADDGTLIDVDWDVPPAYTPDVSLDFSAFTTTSVETQEATRQLVEALQKQQHDADDTNANVPGVSLLSRACRRLLHNELPLLQQYVPWRVIYSTRIHGVSLGTLFANCRREGERHARLPNGLFSLPSATEQPGGPGPDTRPMLLVLELPASTTFRFAEDDAGVRAALAELHKPLTVERASRSSGMLPDYANTMPFNKLYIGAYLSDLLRLESRRYYGTQECFVFQILVPAEKTSSGELAPETTAVPQPQLRVFHASRLNTQFINCRHTSIVIGGGGGGSSLYLDDSLSHGATSACATFNSPPLSVWHNAAATLCAVAGAQQQPSAASTSAEGNGRDDDAGRQHSLSVLNVEVIVMDP